MGLGELIFSFLIFSIVALSVAYGLQSATGTTGQSRNRIQATNLAERELDLYGEEFRAQFGLASEKVPTANLTRKIETNPHPLDGQTDGDDLEIDGLKYTVIRETTWQPSTGQGADACNGGSGAIFPVQAVKVTVEWGPAGNKSSVETRTLLTPRQDRVLGDQAFLSVRVIGVDGLPKPGLNVQLFKGGTAEDTKKTSETGCVVFMRDGTSPATMYEAMVYLAGYVSNRFQATGSVDLAASPGNITRATLSYDEAMQLTVNVVADTGYTLPNTNLPITLFNPALPGISGRRTIYGSTFPRTANLLWPTTTGFSYQSWPGACAHANPGGAVLPAPPVQADGSATITHTLEGVPIEVRNTAGQRVRTTITAVPVDPTGCSGIEQNLPLGESRTGGLLRTSLPRGNWILQVGADQTLQLPPGAPPLQADGITPTIPEWKISIPQPTPKQVFTIRVV